MGAQKVGERLPPLVEAVRAAGHPVIWLSDPMHGNTIVAPCGNKTRLVRSIAEEVAAFRLAVSRLRRRGRRAAPGDHPGRRHRVRRRFQRPAPGRPALHQPLRSAAEPWQALSAVMAWAGAEAIPERNLPLETVA
ncbi:3-deoxy-7-phosphoheptulonate synthase [Pseudomonas aeruginosa]|uniref:3-deoxy-7-phosphoheptulonate synthase n=1 Tax=Pseudomonas aeruginosa TaxID=287 RepID=UPI003CEFC000